MNKYNKQKNQIREYIALEIQKIFDNPKKYLKVKGLEIDTIVSHVLTSVNTKMGWKNDNQLITLCLYEFFLDEYLFYRNSVKKTINSVKNAKITKNK